ncbi:RNA polymerase sigma factor [Streptacidiphilus sp. N1-3]|uniref:RNA polymerase sigma factor n=1 Tax=Streptacidiphilus alkalitolerans TaxID=3342712 RepID=A0ABV6XED5_9ACTN
MAGEVGDQLSPEERSRAELVADLYRQYRSPLVWYLRSRGAADAEAHDAVQEAFAAALRSAAINDPAAWHAWLRTVSTRCLWRARRAEGGGGRIAVETMAPYDLPDAAPASAASVHDVVEARSREQFVLALLDALPPRQRVVFCLHLEGLSVQEIAAELGSRQPAVRKNLSRARRSLRELMSEGDAHEL